MLIYLTIALVYFWPCISWHQCVTPKYHIYAYTIGYNYLKSKDEQDNLFYKPNNIEYQRGSISFNKYMNSNGSNFIISKQDRIKLIEMTSENENHLLSEGRFLQGKLSDFEKYIGLYTICTYFSSFIYCDMDKNNNTLLLDDPSKFPWITSDKKLSWSVFGGTYGDVVCGLLRGGSHLLEIKNHESFLSSTYMIDYNSIYNTYINHSYYKNSRFLRHYEDMNICIKSFRSTDIPSYIDIWNREQYILKWLNNDIWKVGNIDVSFVPLIITITMRNKEDKLERSDSNNKQYNYNILFPISLYETNYPWNIYSNKYWSSFLIMERIWGPSIADVARYLISDEVLNWIQKSSEFLYYWNIALLKLLFMHFASLVSFSLTGRLIYQHCDLHANNIFIISKFWRPSIYNQLFEPINNPYELISDIIFKPFNEMRILDFTFVNVLYSYVERQSINICKTLGEISLNDIENWIAFIFDFNMDINIALEKSNIFLRYQPLEILIENLMENNNWNLIKPYFMGNSKYWWIRWSFKHKYTFDETFNNYLTFDSSLRKTLDILEIEYKKNINVSIPGYMERINKEFNNAISFEVYLRGYFYVPFDLMIFGHCTLYYFGNSHMEHLNSSYFKYAVKTLSLYMTKITSTDRPLWSLQYVHESILLWDRCYKINSRFQNIRLKRKWLDEYLEIEDSGQFNKKKKFPRYIRKWLVKTEEEEEKFIYIVMLLFRKSESEIHFTLAIRIFYKYILGKKVDKEDSIEISLEISNKILSYVSDDSKLYNSAMLLAACYNLINSEIGKFSIFQDLDSNFCDSVLPSEE
ncbi:hypothetical protein cand_016410 [Cryptosporidium andersoni]|uniref:Protein kinase domain-containing protein n=1 Tax=Cryptosporidium andersoni TaxID=117008 RepID=A0A1J4MTA0_9CRYT|nr:hypothetical protein cand_016410 [Cryptosporidium andersoni]